MSAKAVAGLAGVILTLAMGSIAGLGLAGGGLAIAACTAPTTTSPNSSGTPTGRRPAMHNWTDEQVTNAATIVTVGQQLHVPARGWVIAVATAMQESSLHNLGNLGTHNDHDSLGLFQQRPSQGWGTPAQIRNPAYAATQFYNHLTIIANWQDLPLTMAAQKVQKSAYPDAYAKWEDDALNLVSSIGPGLTGMTSADFTQWLNTCTAFGGDGQPASSPIPLPPEFNLPPTTPHPIVVAIEWALTQLGTPYAFGGDCTDAHSGNPARQCDCSSLTMMAYRAGGITIPRTAADQSHAGNPVYSPPQLLPGDLLFIPGSDGTAASPGHVGLYIGQGLLIQSPHTGDHVKITPLANWTPELVQIRRLVNVSQL